MHLINEYLLTDEVVFGGGAAGCPAAIAAVENASDVIPIVQVKMGDKKNGNNSNIKKAL
jgi:succinate dehydrogenase/fumarate reductase flavoprotein subunit